MIREVSALTFTSAVGRRSTNFLRYEIYGEPDADLSCDFALWIVRTDDETILFDTGFSESAAHARGQTIVADVPTALRECGVEPHSVERIILSHLHYDHIGNLEHFPVATVHVQRSEYAFWTGPLATRLQFAQLREEEYFDNLARISDEGRLRLLDGDSAVVPGVRTVLLGGHTVGTQAVVVDAPGRTVVLASDAVHYHDELEQDMPFAVVADLSAMYAAFDTLTALDRAGAHVIPGHDVRTSREYPSTTLPCGAIRTDLLGIRTTTAQEETR